MAAGPNGPGPGYRVEMTGPAKRDFADLLARATAARVGRDILDAIRGVRARLRTDPRRAGEPMYHLRGMRMEVRNLAVGPLYVEYGVHDEASEVVIRLVRWLGDPG